MDFEVEYRDNNKELRWEFATREEAEAKFEELRKAHTFELCLNNLRVGDTEKWISVEVKTS